MQSTLEGAVWDAHRGTKSAFLDCIVVFHCFRCFVRKLRHLGTPRRHPAIMNIKADSKVRCSSLVYGLGSVPVVHPKGFNTSFTKSQGCNTAAASLTAAVPLYATHSSPFMHSEMALQWFSAGVRLTADRAATASRQRRIGATRGRSPRVQGPV